MTRTALALAAVLALAATWAALSALAGWAIARLGERIEGGRA